MSGQSEAETVLSVADLRVDFTTQAGVVHAVRGISFDLAAGEVLAVVGESGSGKSVSARAALGLLPGNATVDGSILLGTEQLVGLSEQRLRRIRGNDITMVFQDPMTCLDPTMSVGNQIAEPLLLHKVATRRDVSASVVELLTRVGIENPERRRKQYPHMFSGGQRQRIAIAIAIACRPRVLLADEPTTALDVRVQAQILSLLGELRRENAMAMVFITHDLGVVAGIADRVAVMYAGRIVEIGTTDEVFYHPQHPYTWGLLGSLPGSGQTAAQLYAIPGAPPGPYAQIHGDAFAPRNPYAQRIDWEQEPPLFPVSATHYAATWLLAPDAPTVNPPPEIAKRWRKYAEFTPLGTKVDVS
ncbi:MAG: ABC transporter ATP-binding protein [Propionibacteriaceae bacterium]|jgi:oligopeptide transport system ATP-binding protein|nr:ABC transporter ATP-binding protein [Propionibacteriaceae bacterium]